MNTRNIFIVIALLIIIGGGYMYLNLKPAVVTENAADVAEQIDNTESEEFATYRISQDESKVSFMIDEVLNGKDFTAVGETNQVAGDISVSLTDQAKGSIGEIVVNARTIKTDSEKRDGAISKFILKSDQDINQFITFKPRAITPISVGAEGVAEMSRYQIAGDLTIAGVTRPVTFAIAAQSITEEKIIASGEARVSRNDFGLTVPSVPFVASVSDEVTLKADIVANRIR